MPRLGILLASTVRVSMALTPAPSPTATASASDDRVRVGENVESPGAALILPVAGVAAASRHRRAPYTSLALRQAGRRARRPFGRRGVVKGGNGRTGSTTHTWARPAHARAFC